MNRPALTLRLISAAAAVAITLLLLEGVVSIAEPQRSVLIARSHRFEAPIATTTPLAVALNDAVKAQR